MGNLNMALIYTQHREALSFLSAAQAALERQESVNGLMLGVVLRLVQEPLAYGSPPFLATVTSGAGLRVAAVMTPPYNLQLYAADDRHTAALERVAEALYREQWPVPGVIAPKSIAGAFASIWRRRTGATGRMQQRMRIYELRQVVQPRLPAGVFRAATVEEMELVRRWAQAFHRDCFGNEREALSVGGAERSVIDGTLFFWVDGTPASMAARSRPTPHGESIGLVYTPPDRRGQGYASAVVARLSQRILDDGKQFCTLYTDLANPTSNRIYQRIGYSAVADVVEIRFERPG